LTEWSQYGATSVDVAAPGVEMHTTRTKQSFNDPEYDKVSGTSFSAPVVSGVAALVKAKNLDQGAVELEPSDLKAILQASISKLNLQSGLLKSGGVVNAANALSILNSPRPVVTVEAVNYDDSTSVTSNISYKNGLIDPGESGMLRLRLKSLWDNALSANVTLTAGDNSILIPVAMQNIDYWPKGEIRELSFYIESGIYTGNKRFPFKLLIEVTGEQGSSSVTRSFFINTGYLENMKLHNGVIQKDRTDDYQYFHLNMPQGTQYAAVEVIYNNNDSRDIGVLASLNQKPLIHFNRLNGSSYWDNASWKSDSDTGFERIDIPVSTNISSSLNVLVFNKPNGSASKSFSYNKSYSVKGCYFSDDDGNSGPRVSAGTNQIVLAGSTVTLDGIVSDIDGEITRVWWNSLGGVPLSSSNGTQATFIAPASGEFSFTLTAIDNGCKLSRDTVKIEIKNEVGEVPGFQLNPSKIVVEENGSIDLLITAIDEAKIIDNLELESSPEGLNFIKGSGQQAGNRIVWENAGPVDTYKVRFSANTASGNIKSFILIDVVPRGGKGKGGGCSSAGSSSFDPLFWIYIILCFYFLSKTRSKSIKL
ncbi:MAG: S8 family serine peptidase, partial [Gammaproteobacteria bacterium]|nr:S8 family serine peptidase [Gammaproteobacteria bacterium]